MAKKHRRLFPLLSESNQTFDCSSGLCDPACPYNCYPYPDYFSPSPSSPPPPPPPPPLPPSISAVDQEARIDQISSNVIIIVAVASVLSFFLLVACYLAAKLSSHGRNNNSFQQDRDREREEYFDENQVEHPIWFIRTIGLQQSVINSITICRYKRDEGLIEGTACSVCLNEFHEYETLRLLPKCDHAFHITCIDTWLRSHTNCPLCRAQIVSNSIPLNSALIEGNSDNGFTQLERSDDNDDRNLERSVVQSENMAEQPDTEREEGVFKEPINSNEDHSLNSNQSANTQMESLDHLEDSGHDQELLNVNGDRSLNSIRDKTIQMRSSNLFEGSGTNQELLNTNEDHYLHLNRKTGTEMESSNLFEGSDQNHEPLDSYGDNSLNANTQMKNFGSCTDSDQNQEQRSSDQPGKGADPETAADNNTILEKSNDSNANFLDDKNDYSEFEDASIQKELDHESSNRLKLSGSSSISQLLHRGPVTMKRSVACGRRNNKSMNRILPL